MEVLITVLCSVMILLSIFLVVAVLMQSGKDSRLSGTIAGGAETFFGKTKGKTIDRVLSKATTIVSIIFVILVLLVYVFSGIVSDNKVSDSSNSNTTTQNESVETKEENHTQETETAEN
ncbi:MAG: preprotein translocase subunit SecG [Clostridia bacterium]|nr:preprotein translocase subunit SecG [Clostridia bacterium]